MKTGLIVILSVWVASIHSLIFLTLPTKPTTQQREEASFCVTDAINCLSAAPGDKQRRVFSDLRKALERDPEMTVWHIIDLGKSLDRDKGEYPMPQIRYCHPGEYPAPKLVSNKQ